MRHAALAPLVAQTGPGRPGGAGADPSSEEPVVGPMVRGFAVTPPPGVLVPPQPPGWDQLLYARSGMLTVRTAAGIWAVPPHRALWMPAGIAHRIELTGRVALRNLYLATPLRVLTPEIRVLDVSPLLRELVLHAVITAPLDLAAPADARLVGVLLDQLAGAGECPLQLPVPRDPRGAQVAEWLLADPVGAGAPDPPDTGAPAPGPLGVDLLAARVPVSRRTLERIFRAETGLGVGQWRERARMLAAVRLLAGGTAGGTVGGTTGGAAGGASGGTAGGPSVTAVAAAVGYATPSGFAAAFRRALGVPPSRYLSPPAVTPRSSR